MEGLKSLWFDASCVIPFLLLGLGGWNEIAGFV